MKIINSGGGPFIAINDQDLCCWSGVYGLNFFEGISSTETDYDAICELGLTDRNDVTGMACGREGAILFLDLPLPTLIVEATVDNIYIAQIETCEERWSESELSVSDFEAPAEWKDSLRLMFKTGEFLLFDSAAFPSRLSEDEFLKFHIEGGSYVCEWSRQEWEGKAEMYFIRLRRDR